MVWAETRWVSAGNEQFEVRSTADGILSKLELPDDEPPEGAPAYRALVNVVMGDPSAKVRKLPTVYFGKTPLYTSRDRSELMAKLVRTVDVIVRADDVATYLLHPCRLGDRHGLYGYDFHNRSTYRRALERAGMAFSDDPFATFTEEGKFWCEDWGDFSPDFLVLRNAPDFTEDPDEVITTRGAQLAFIAGSYRIGGHTPREISDLIRRLSAREGFSAENPDAIIRALVS